MNPYENKVQGNPYYKLDNINNNDDTPIISQRPSGIDEFYYLLPDQICIPDNFALLCCSPNSRSNTKISNTMNHNGSSFVQILCQTLNEYFTNDLTNNLTTKKDLVTIFQVAMLRMKNDCLINSHDSDIVHLRCSLKQRLFFQLFPITNQSVHNCDYDYDDTQIVQTDSSNNISSIILRSFKRINLMNLSIKFLTRGESIFYHKSKGKCITIFVNHFKDKSGVGNEIMKKKIVSLFQQLDFDCVCYQTDIRNTSLEYFLSKG